MCPTAQHLVDRTYAFHVKQHLHLAEGPMPMVQLMRIHLIMEETAELLLALHNREEEKFVDGLGALMYVTAGSYVAMYGKTLDQDFAVQPVNMPSSHHGMIHRVLKLVRRINYCLSEPVWEEINIRDLTDLSIELCAQCGYDPIAVFNAVADSNDTKWYKEENGQRVKDKGPDYRAPVLAPLLRGWN